MAKEQERKVDLPGVQPRAFGLPCWVLYHWILFGDDDEMGLIEIKWPFKYRDCMICKTCDDNHFHLEKYGNDIKLHRTHDYFYQVTGQLAITDAVFCDFVTWTCSDNHIERIYLDTTLWSSMLQELTAFYFNSLGPEIIDRIPCNYIIHTHTHARMHTCTHTRTHARTHAQIHTHHSTLEEASCDRRVAARQ